MRTEVSEALRFLHLGFVNLACRGVKHSQMIVSQFLPSYHLDF